MATRVDPGATPAAGRLDDQVGQRHRDGTTVVDGIVRGMKTKRSPNEKPATRAKPAKAEKPATAEKPANTMAKKRATKRNPVANARKAATAGTPIELDRAEAEAAAADRYRQAIRERMQLPQGWTFTTLLELMGLGEREPGRSNWLRPSRLIPRARDAVLCALAGWTPTREERTRVESYVVASDEVDGGRIDATDRRRIGAWFALGRAVSDARAALGRELEASRAFAALLAVADQEAMREEARRSGEDACVMPRPPKSLRKHLEVALDRRLSRLPLRDPVRELARRVRDGDWVRNTDDWDVIDDLERDVTAVLSALMDTEVVSNEGRVETSEGANLIEVSLDDNGGIWLKRKSTADFKDRKKSRTSPLHQGMEIGALLVALTDATELLRVKVSNRSVEKLSAYLAKRVGVNLRRGEDGKITYRHASGVDVRFVMVPFQGPT